MPREIVGRERISRLLFQKGQFSRQKNAVKARAFIPPEDRQLSVAYTEGLSEEQILEIAKRVLAGMRVHNPDINYYGRADFFASEVLAALSETPRLEATRLRIIRDDEGYSGHCTVQGWPEDVDIWDLIASKIATNCKLELLA